LYDLTGGGGREGAIHVGAGDDAPTAAQLAAMAGAAFGSSPPRFVKLGEAPEVEDRAGAFLPYFRVRGTFDAARGRRLGFVPPPLSEYFDTLMAYARAARWGKRPQNRWEAGAHGLAVA
jgi:long-chain acyl-CoA synthetase